MTANTISGQAALFALALEAGEMKSGFVTASADTTHVTIGKLANQFADSYFVSGTMHLMGTNVYSLITTYTGSSGAFVLQTALTGVLPNSRVEFCFWDDNKFGAAMGALNRAIIDSYHRWWREVVTTLSDAVITLAANTFSYDLPTACVDLLQIRPQTTSTYEYPWLDPQDLWRVEGEEGALKLRFYPNYTGGGSYYRPDQSHIYEYSSGAGNFFSNAFATYVLCLRYRARETPFTSLTSTTELPLDYMGSVGAEIYMTERLTKRRGTDLQSDNVALPQIQQRAQMARDRLIRKPPAPRKILPL